jgi:hypothetical protein
VVIPLIVPSRDCTKLPHWKLAEPVCCGQRTLAGAANLKDALPNSGEVMIPSAYRLGTISPTIMTYPRVVICHSRSQLRLVVTFLENVLALFIEASSIQSGAPGWLARGKLL